MENAPFIKNMVEAIQTNSKRIESIKENVELINDSVNKIKKGLKRKMQIECAAGLIGAVVSVVTFGIGGTVINSFQQLVMNSIIDFGDPQHIIDTVQEIGGLDTDECMKLLGDGKNAAAGIVVGS